MHRLAPTTLLMLPLLTAPVAAQAHPLIGTWNISYAAGMRMENGAATPVNGTGTLAIVLQGDSLIGTLTPDPIGDQPARPPSRMATKAVPGDVTFETRSPAQLNIGGEAREATGVSTWVFKVSGDSLTGTVQRRIEGIDLPMAPQPPAPVTGTRAPTSPAPGA